MTIHSERFDILVIGGGPAGVMAAARAVERGKRVGLVDDNPTLGGQIYRGHNLAEVESLAAAFKLLSSVTSLRGQRIFHQPEPGLLLAEALDGVSELRYDKLIVATGARERFLPFPGWTLPNVMGAGGLQAMVKSGLPVRGKRVVIAGTGPLLLAVAAHLREAGAVVLRICEQAPWRALASFGTSLLRFPGKLKEALQFRSKLSGIPFVANCWPVAANGADRIESVMVSRHGHTETISCDYLACAFHMVPNVELPLLLGCQLSEGCVKVDDSQQTSVPGIYCAGEPTGVGGVELALLEGAIAGVAASGATPGADLLRARAHAQRFAGLLHRTFSLRPELKSLAHPDTMVCRCEDVTYSRLQEHRSWRSAKLHTRCGMGPCQGRVCGPATQFLFGWNPDSVRPPMFPARVASLLGAGTTDQQSAPNPEARSLA